MCHRKGVSDYHPSHGSAWMHSFWEILDHSFIGAVIKWQKTPIQPDGLNFSLDYYLPVIRCSLYVPWTRSTFSADAPALRDMTSYWTTVPRAWEGVSGDHSTWSDVAPTGTKLTSGAAIGAENIDSMILVHVILIFHLFFFFFTYVLFFFKHISFVDWKLSLSLIYYTDKRGKMKCKPVYA